MSGDSSSAAGATRERSPPRMRGTVGEGWERLKRKKWIEDAHTEALRATATAAEKKRARGFEDKERKMMQSEDRRSGLVDLALAPSRAPRRFRVGQSVLQWWAPWFKDCPADDFPSTLKKKSRPTWFASEVVQYAGVEPITYCGRPFEGHCYDVY